MRSLLLFFLTLVVSTSILANTITPEQAKILACRTAKSIQFNFEGSCSWGLSLIQESRSNFYFSGYDSIGYCHIRIIVNKSSQKSKVKTSCN